MTESNHQPPPGDVLDRAAAAVTGMAIPDPPADLLAATLAAVHNRLAVAEAAEAARRRQRRLIMRGMSVGGLAACLAVAAGVFWGGGAAHAAVLERALENVNTAKSFRHVTKMTMAGKTMFEMRMYKQDARMRFEVPEVMALVVDADGRALQLDLKAKTATRPSLDDLKKQAGKPGEQAEGLARKLKEKKGEGVTRLADEKLDGVATEVYAVKGVKIGDVTHDWKVWVDPKIEVPVRMEMTGQGPAEAVVAVSEYSDWNKPQDPALFSLDLPAGFKLADPKPAPKPSPERTHQVSLKIAAEAMAAAPCMVVTNTQRLLPGRPELTIRMLVRGKQFRMEFLPPGGEKAVGALVTDADKDQSLHLDFGAKSAKFEKRTGPRPATVPDLAAGFRQLTDEDGEAAGEEKVGDVTAKVYKLKSAKFLGMSGPDVKATVWLDPATSLPVKVTVGDGKMELRFEKFEWPATLSDSLFSLTPPKGYTVGEFVPPASGPAKK